MPRIEQLDPTGIISNQEEVKETSDFLNDLEVKTLNNVEEMITSLRQSTKTQYETAVGELDKWLKFDLLSPHLENAKAGLTLAKNRVIEIANETRDTILDSISEARNTMDTAQFTEYLNEVPKVFEIQTMPALQSFSDGVQAVTEIGTQLTDIMPTKATDIAQNATDQVMQLGNSVYENMTNTGKNTIDRLSRMGENAADNLTQIRESTVGKLMKAGEGASTQLKQMGNTATNQLQKGLSSVRSLFTNGAKETLTNFAQVPKSVSI